jgi:anti-sigma factor (TIGR02949 family)
MNEVRGIDCEEALRRLFEYLDAELLGESQREMEQHLERCRSCFSRVEFEKQLKAYTAELRSEPVSPELELRIRKVLDSFKC